MAVNHTHTLQKQLPVQHWHIDKGVIISEQDIFETLPQGCMLQDVLDHVDALQGEIVVVIMEVKLDKITVQPLLFFNWKKKEKQEL